MISRLISKSDLTSNHNSFFQACEHSGHACFIDQLLGFTSWDESGERIPEEVIDDNGTSSNSSIDSSSNSEANSTDSSIEDDSSSNTTMSRKPRNLCR